MKREKTSWRRVVLLASWFAVDSLVASLPAPRLGARTLIIRLDNIGDFVIWLASAQRIVAHYRGSGNKVILLASSAWAEWAVELAIFDEVLSLDRKRYAHDLRYRLQTGTMIRRLGCSTAVLPGYSRSWASGDAVIRISGATLRIGSEGDPYSGTGLERHLGDGWFTQLLPVQPTKMNEFARNAEFLQHLLHHSIPLEVGNLRTMGKTPSKIPGASAFGVTGRYYVLFPGASEAIKCWPLPYFRELARRVYEQTGWTGVICGGPSDKQRAEELVGSMDLGLIDLAGKTTLWTLTGILSEAAFLVSNDTSAVHMAASLSVPTVCILGGGHVDRFLPYPSSQDSLQVLPTVVTHPMECFDCNWDCIYKVPPGDPSPCIANVALEDVWRETEAIIRRLSTAQRVEVEA